MDIGLLLLRLAVGLTIAAHGAQMLSGWFGGQGLAKTGQLFEALGFPPGRSYALLAALAEIGGGPTRYSARQLARTEDSAGSIRRPIPPAVRTSIRN